jgi:protease-4
MPYYAPPPRSSPVGTFFRWMFRLGFLSSLALNVLIILFLVWGFVNLNDGQAVLHERHYAGDRLAREKVAVVRIDGVIMEGMTGYAEKQLEAAQTDRNVKAVVLRINSPGGTITASDDLYKRIKELRDGDPKKNTQAKPVIVSMGSLAASGGYYIAMPARQLLAEPTTLTGSIGVYASFLNVAKLANEHGVKMEVIKAGAVKDSGSPFKEMTPQERQLWTDMVDSAYDRFLTVVAKGRHPDLDKETLTAQEQAELEKDKKSLLAIIPQETRDLHVEKPGKPGEPPVKETVKYTRYRADGGIFTAEKAKAYGLVDQIGYLDNAIELARKEAHLGEQYQVVTYDRPVSLLGGLFGVQTPQQLPGTQFDASRLAEGATPRVWYLAPQSELSGMLTAIGHE